MHFYDIRSISLIKRVHLDFKKNSLTFFKSYDDSCQGYMKLDCGGGAVDYRVRPASGRLGVRIQTARDRAMSHEQVVTAPLLNAQQ